MLEVLAIALVVVLVKDHTARMKELGKQAREYGKVAR